MPNKENIRLWVDALRSGEYEQTSHKLAKRDYLGDGKFGDKIKYCCLGVVCEVAIKNGVEVDRKEVGGHIQFDNHGAMLPRSVAVWLGFEAIEHGDPVISVDGIRATTANDTHGWTFERIAEALEERYLADVPAAE